MLKNNPKTKSDPLLDVVREYEDELTGDAEETPEVDTVWSQMMSEIASGQSRYDDLSDLVEEHTRRMAQGMSWAVRAEWTTAYVNDLPDSAFLYISPGGEKDEDGKTTPRSLRHFPYKNSSGDVDLPHLRNAIARAPQAKIPEAAIERVQKEARKILYGEKSSPDLSDLFGEMVAFGMKAMDARGGDYVWIGSSHNAWMDRSHDIIPLALIVDDINHQTEMIKSGKATQYGYGLWEDHNSSRIIGTCDLRAVVDGGRSCLEMGTLFPGGDRLKDAKMSIGYKALMGDDGYKAVFVYERSRLEKTVPVNARTFWRVKRRASDGDIARAGARLAEVLAR